MFSLPNIAPQDSYTLWYTSSTTQNHPSSDSHSNNHSHDPFSTNPHTHPPHTSRRHHASHRSPLARLRLDEEYIQRRKLNIQNFGSSWIKPPGMSKSLHQMREEEREMREHQESLRREQLAAELAEAEAEGADELLQGEGMDGEIMEDAGDLDELIPDADVTGIEEEEDEEEDGDEEEEDEEDEENTQESIMRPNLQPQIPVDVYREALARGRDIRGGSTLDGTFSSHNNTNNDDEEDEEGGGHHSGMLREEDLVHSQPHHAFGEGDEDGDLNMGADLDAEIPSADEGYEHTDTEAELSTSEEEDEEEEGSSDDHLPQQLSMVRSDGTQNSMDLRRVVSQSRRSSARIGGAGSGVGSSSSPRLRRTRYS